jgi:hypothetical protein
MTMSAKPMRKTTDLADSTSLVCRVSAGESFSHGASTESGVGAS